MVFLRLYTIQPTNRRNFLKLSLHRRAGGNIQQVLNKSAYFSFPSPQQFSKVKRMIYVVNATAAAQLKKLALPTKKIVKSQQWYTATVLGSIMPANPFQNRLYPRGIGHCWYRPQAASPSRCSLPSSTVQITLLPSEPG